MNGTSSAVTDEVRVRWARNVVHMLWYHCAGLTPKVVLMDGILGLEEYREVGWPCEGRHTGVDDLRRQEEDDPVSWEGRGGKERCLWVASRGLDHLCVVLSVSIVVMHPQIISLCCFSLSTFGPR
mmetsp:Transcript_8236/g.23529  ORF Transcript_8236/g.23529 Transcript_8236/m.23529 type:complete len:125 (-) Transcript_8236:25-399(-)